jgi:hypothetical protein
LSLLCRSICVPVPTASTTTTARQRQRCEVRCGERARRHAGSIVGEVARCCRAHPPVIQSSLSHSISLSHTHMHPASCACACVRVRARACVRVVPRLRCVASRRAHVGWVEFCKELRHLLVGRLHGQVAHVKTVACSRMGTRKGASERE